MNQALDELRKRVTTDWRVTLVDHHHLSECRENMEITKADDGGITMKPKKAWGSQGMRFPTSTFTWAEAGDMEVEGNTVRLYITHKGLTSRTRPGQRECTRTYTFIPPMGDE